MNLELLNPFAQGFPENFETSIEAAGLCARFNPRGVFAGHFLAVGRLDGAVAVYDFETKGVVRWLEGHVKAVTTLCWSLNSRYLLSASRDWNAIIWDLSSAAWNTPEGERRDTVQPVFVDLRPDGGRWELETSVEDPDGDEDEEEEGTKKLREVSSICRFNPRGDLIYVGTSKGNINIWDVQTKTFLWSENTGSNTTIKHMEFDDKGSTLVINSNDRCIRVIRLLPTAPSSSDSEPEEDDEEENGDKGPAAADEDEDAEIASPPAPRPPRVPWFEIQHRFQDLVNRTPWNGCGFSRDGEYIIGGAGHKASHNIYIWDRESGGLIKILEGPKDPLEDLDWHPIRPLIASVSSLGLIHIWTTGITENWSAYAPGFEELDENMEYPEKEDEFDIEDESVIKRRKADLQDRPVDIVSVPPPASTLASLRTGAEGEEDDDGSFA
ncbi:hypothetical protein RQP46_010284 [Phenoliferia psychrophenolica]